MNKQQILEIYRCYGQIALTESKEFITIKIIELEPQFQRKGIGQRFFNDIYEYAKSKNKGLKINPHYHINFSPELKIKIYQGYGFEFDRKGRYLIKK